MEYFPGVYWCTAFGKKMHEAIGKERFTNLSNVDYLEFDNETIAFKLPVPFDEEHLEERLTIESKIAEEIGKQYFFEINDPERNPSYPEDLKNWFQNIKKN